MNPPNRLSLAMVIATAPGAGPDQYAEAEQLLRRALELDPLNRPRIYQALIGLYRRWGRDAQVDSVYVAAVDRYLGPARGPGALPLSPEVLDLIAEAADFHAHAGNGATARAVIERSVRSSPSAASYPRIRTLADSLKTSE